MTLGALVFLWIDPISKISEARDVARKNDTLVITAALVNYASDNQGKLPTTVAITTNKKVLCSASASLSCAGDTQTCVTITGSDFFTKYLGALPVDPVKTSAVDTGYYLSKDANGFLVVGPCASTTMAITTKIKPITN